MPESRGRWPKSKPELKRKHLKRANARFNAQRRQRREQAEEHRSAAWKRDMAERLDMARAKAGISNPSAKQDAGLKAKLTSLAKNLIGRGSKRGG